MRAQTYHRIFKEVAGYAVPVSLGAVQTPMLMLAGGKESVLIRRAVEIIPSTMSLAAGRIVPGVGHGWNVEAPALFNATARAWISGPPLPGGPESTV